MRHGNKINQLGRTTSHRHAMMANMASSLIISKRIFTTLAKAKALRKFIEPLVTKSKSDSTHSRRIVFSYLQNKHSVKELFSTIATKVADRPGGYVRILKTGVRPGDNAEMCMIEFVDFNELLGGGKISEKVKTAAKRTRRSSAKKETVKVEETAINTPNPIETVENSETTEVDNSIADSETSTDTSTES
ncbi:MAG: 50S ribosomal protein L17 [Bacteroidia bacterium]|nr:50S ribosomal protein L17 [Bacteroidia bacterium]